MENFEALTGDDVSMEEAAISMALKELGGRRDLLELEAVVEANGLPGAESLKQYHVFLDKAQDGVGRECAAACGAWG